MQPHEDPEVEDALMDGARHDPHHESIDLPHQSPSDAKPGTTTRALFLTGYFLAILYIIYLNLKLTGILPQKGLWMYSNIPFGLCLASFTWALNQAVNNPRRQMKNLGRIMIMILVYSTDALLFLFNLLACAQADGFITIKFIVMFIPLLLLSAIVYYFICFILPGFLDTENQFYKEASLLVAYYAGALLTAIFVAIRLDQFITWRYPLVFLPLFSAFALHGIYLMFEIFDKKIKVDFRESVIFLLLVTFLILATIKLDRADQQQESASWTIILVPIYILLAMGASKSLASVVKKARRGEI